MSDEKHTVPLFDLAVLDAYLKDRGVAVDTSDIDTIVHNARVDDERFHIELVESIIHATIEQCGWLTRGIRMIESAQDSIEHRRSEALADINALNTVNSLRFNLIKEFTFVNLILPHTRAYHNTSARRDVDAFQRLPHISRGRILLSGVMSNSNQNDDAPRDASPTPDDAQLTTARWHTAIDALAAASKAPGLPPDVAGMVANSYRESVDRWDSYSEAKWIKGAAEIAAFNKDTMDLVVAHLNAKRRVLPSLEAAIEVQKRKLALATRALGAAQDILVAEHAHRVPPDS
ncbi:hypothetical protein B0H17DRAFT_1220874 [Mycena rosella]|uniref:Uncharacterized protein n=1 Tax=Mycena rosella TaxID=1033263 RepID=A0AAD7B8D7_MYCRO|nr:hypothetical protein B0H17DRAFT_1220874 [Mycena rosella]